MRGSETTRRVLGELICLGGMTGVLFGLVTHFGVPERVLHSREQGRGPADALVFLFAIIAIGLILFAYRRWRESIRLSKEAANQRAHQDPLTGLPNRVLLNEQLTEALVASRGTGRQVAVLFCDLDRFKQVNDNYGHECGDVLLTALAGRLQEAVRGKDLLARLGGDEFVVVCHDVGRPAEAEAIAERIRLALAHPLFLEHDEISISASVGIALGDAKTETPDSLLRNADAAMYRAKALGPGQHVVFDRSMRNARQNRAKIEKRLERAIDKNEFRLVYQPILAVDTQQIVGVEALLRWEDPERGVISPAEFVPILEETGLIVRVGAWALEEACRQAKTWRKAHPTLPPLRVAVNVSPRQLTQGAFADVVSRALNKTGMHPSQLCLEITEMALAGDVVSAWSGLRKVKALGVQLAIDDFGTGYSSVAYVRNFALDILKIDQSFVRGITEGVEDAAIVKAVIHMAHALGLSTVAEGVEMYEQLTELRDLGCDYAQGFYFSRPQPPEVIDELLADTASALQRIA